MRKYYAIALVIAAVGIIACTQSPVPPTATPVRGALSTPTPDYLQTAHEHLLEIERIMTAAMLNHAHWNYLAGLTPQGGKCEKEWLEMTPQMIYLTQQISGAASATRSSILVFDVANASGYIAEASQNLDSQASILADSIACIEIQDN